MRTALAAAAFAALVLGTTAANAAAGHYVCSADGIKSWTTDASATDAKGWTYSGDRTSYKDKGTCKKSS